MTTSERLDQVVEPKKPDRRGTIAAGLLCPVEACGEVRGRGRPPAGWISVQQTSDLARPWFCSWYCASTYAGLRALAELTPQAAR